jgi:hypothetical protein
VVLVTGRFTFDGSVGVDKLRPDLAAVRQVIDREEIVQAGTFDELVR